MTDAIDEYIASRPDPFREDGPLHWCVHMHQELGLPMAPLPSAFLDGFDRTAEWCFSSRSTVETLAQLHELIEEAADGDAPSYVAVGHSSGTSPLYSYVVVTPQVAVFLQRPHGGLTGDAAASSEAIGDALGTIGRLLKAVEGKDLGGQYVIDDRGLLGSKWVKRPPEGGDWLWNGSNDPLGDAYMDLLGD